MPKFREHSRVPGKYTVSQVTLLTLMMGSNGPCRNFGSTVEFQESIPLGYSSDLDDGNNGSCRNFGSTVEFQENIPLVRLCF